MKKTILGIALIGVSLGMHAQTAEKIVTSETTNGLTDFIYKGGNVGIGTITPDAKLHVQQSSTNYSWTPVVGTVGVFESATYNRAFLSIVGKSNGQSELWFGDSDSQASGRVRYDHINDNLQLWTAGSPRMTINNYGYVGVGMTTPFRSLVVDGSETDNLVVRRNGGAAANNNSMRFQNLGQDVYIGASYNNNFAIGFSPDLGGTAKFIIKSDGNAALFGKLEAKELKVTLTPTADFVFEETYKLPKLEFIEEFVKSNYHLPEIASAKEMEKNGVNVGSFQIQLLQKIEELTLYTIEQEKKINELEKLKFLVAKMQSDLESFKK